MGQSTDAFSSISVTIENGAAVSDGVQLAKLSLIGVAVLVPSAWTGADIGFEVSVDGSVWVPLYDDTGARVKISGVATNASRVYIAPAEVWAAGAFPYLRLVSLNTSTGANINQGGARSLMLIRLAT
jgi:hypothetical protein